MMPVFRKSCEIQFQFNPFLDLSNKPCAVLNKKYKKSYVIWKFWNPFAIIKPLNLPDWIIWKIQTAKFTWFESQILKKNQSLKIFNFLKYCQVPTFFILCIYIFLFKIPLIEKTLKKLQFCWFAQILLILHLNEGS